MGLMDKVNNILKGEDKGLSLEEELKGSVDKDKLLERIRHNNSRDMLSNKDLNNDEIETSEQQDNRRSIKNRFTEIDARKHNEKGDQLEKNSEKNRIGLQR
ncbi:MAG: hypothetical protein ACOX2N_00905 [Peptococcia bacterium]|jgi:hypothetical protein